ncbi:hypothetical protein SDC9_193582 [bioreactor metagenome]|uniref:Uncharacterized protein n=1 Tax=bioreactor metagenome TaxID=1076179 RepID=A0A645IF55_9ZZZZ
MAFAMELSTSFYVFRRQYTHAEDQTDRVTSLLKLCGNLDRLIEEPELMDINDKIDFEKIEKCLNELRRDSLKYLDDALSHVIKESRQEK